MDTFKQDVLDMYKKETGQELDERLFCVLPYKYYTPILADDVDPDMLAEAQANIYDIIEELHNQAEDNKIQVLLAIGVPPHILRAYAQYGEIRIRYWGKAGDESDALVYDTQSNLDEIVDYIEENTSDSVIAEYGGDVSVLFVVDTMPVDGYIEAYEFITDRKIYEEQREKYGAMCEEVQLINKVRVKFRRDAINGFIPVEDYETGAYTYVEIQS